MTSEAPSAPAVWFGQPLVPGKMPVKKNLFEEVIHATGTLELVPVFPYLDDGAIVPCLSVSLGKAGTQRFQFFHDNVVPEVLSCLAEKQGALKAGHMMVLPNLHGVNNFLKDLQDPSAYLVVLITIRVNYQDEQREGFLIRCEHSTPRTEPVRSVDTSNRPSQPTRWGGGAMPCRSVWPTRPVRMRSASPASSRGRGLVSAVLTCMCPR